METLDNKFSKQLATQPRHIYFFIDENKHFLFQINNDGKLSSIDDASYMYAKNNTTSSFFEEHFKQNKFYNE